MSRAFAVYRAVTVKDVAEGVRTYVRVFVCCIVVWKKIGINRIDEINIRKLRTLQYGTMQEDTVRYGTEEKKSNVG